MEKNCSVIDLMSRYLNQIVKPSIDASVSFECHWDGEPGEPGYSEGEWTTYDDNGHSEESYTDYTEHYDSY